MQPEQPEKALANSSYCPPAATIVNPTVFSKTVEIKPDDTAFKTVSDYKILDAQKSKSGARMIAAYERCRLEKPAT